MARGVYAMFRRMALYALFLLLAVPQLGAGEFQSFLLISDIHFNPYESRATAQKLAAADVVGWEAIFEAAPHAANKSMYGNDSNYGLLKSALKDAAQRAKNPDFILYPGDFMAHEWYSQYTACFGSDTGFEEFTTKAIAFIGLQFRKYFGDTPVLPTLGNDDSYCGDYLIQPKGAFLAMFTAVWEQYLGKNADTKSFKANFPVGGYFDMAMPKMPNHRLVVLNTVLMSQGYPKAPCDNGQPSTPPSICMPASAPPGQCEMQWLEGVLAAAKANKEKVWLLMHIPPGINSYNTSESGTPSLFWDSTYTAQFYSIAAQYGDMLQMSFAGHTHMDDFRLIDYGAGQHLTKIAPAVSPIFDNNPAYQLYIYDRSSGAIIDYTTYYLDLAATGSSTISAPTCYFANFSVSTADTWGREYDFTTAYKQKRFSAAEIAALFGNPAFNGSTTAQKYALYYGVSTSGLQEGVQAQSGVYRCCVLSLTAQDYADCSR